MPNAQATTTVDDERIRVTTWSFPDDGDETTTHAHEHDYVVVPVSGGNFTVTAADGTTRQLDQVAGAPYLGTAGTTHNVTNSSGGPATFVEIELKH